MKKILTITILAAILMSSACAKDMPKPDETQTTVTQAPVVKAPALTIDDINGIIDSVKKEYAESSEMKLSDGTVITTEPKMPVITAEAVTNGAVSKEQMSDYTKYMSNIRILACDKLSGAYLKEGNTIQFGKNENGEDMGSYIFLDPVKAGYNNAVEIFESVNTVLGNKDIAIDVIIVRNNMVSYMNNATQKTLLLCPSVEENAILTAISESAY